LRQECDDLVEISAAHLRPSVELVVGAEPAEEEERQTVGAYASRAPSNGHGPASPLAPRAALPAGSHAAPAIYTGPVIAEYQRAAQPALSQPGPTANSSRPVGGPMAPAVTGQGPAALGARPGLAGPPGPQPGVVAQPGTPALPAIPAQGLAGQGLAGQPGMPGPSGTPSQPGAGSQRGASPQLGAQPGLPAQPGQQGLPGQQGAQQFGSVAMQPPGQAAPGLPQRGTGHHAAPSSAPEAPPPPGQVHHGHHELVPQAGPAQPGTPPGMAQPYQAPGSLPVQGPQHPTPMRPPVGMAVPERAATGQAQPGPAQPAMAQPGLAQPGMAQPGMAGGAAAHGLAQPGVPAYQAAPTTTPGFRGQGPDLMAGQVPAGSRMPPAHQGQALAGGPAGPAAPGRPAPPAAAPAQPGQHPGGPGPYQAAAPGRAVAGPIDQRAQQYPAQLPGHPDGGAYIPQQGPHSGPQPAAQASVPQPVAVSLADAVQAAHGEGFNFGQTVARDAPALWLEAVLARKPRMPSDLEARLLQDSSLPIDSLLHDEVRHALRRGFWDALERVRH
jgi:hypothetical protein